MSIETPLKTNVNIVESWCLAIHRQWSTSQALRAGLDRGCKPELTESYSSIVQLVESATKVS
jgi:hypothetical protein